VGKRETRWAVYVVGGVDLTPDPSPRRRGGDSDMLESRGHFGAEDALKWTYSAGRVPPLLMGEGAGGEVSLPTTKISSA
jgi:hypothetical protein